MPADGSNVFNVNVAVGACGSRVETLLSAFSGEVCCCESEVFDARFFLRLRGREYFVVILVVFGYASRRREDWWRYELMFGRYGMMDQFVVRVM